MSVAERARRYRTRQRIGVVVVPVEVTWNDIDTLEAAGLVTWSQPDDRGALAEAVRTALNQWCDGVTRVAED
jgi:hypothetical protein